MRKQVYMNAALHDVVKTEARKRLMNIGDLTDIVMCDWILKNGHTAEQEQAALIAKEYFKVSDSLFSQLGLTMHATNLDD